MRSGLAKHRSYRAPIIALDSEAFAEEIARTVAETPLTPCSVCGKPTDTAHILLSQHRRCWRCMVAARTGGR